MGEMQVVSPAAEAWRPGTLERPTVKAPAGRNVAILSNGWSSMNVLAPTMAELLTTQFEARAVHVEAIPLSEQMPSGQFEKVISNADLAIVGLAN